MTHIRTQIRKAIVSTIDNIDELDHVDVYDNLARKPTTDELPVISVRTGRETSSRESKDDDLDRFLKINISIMASSTGDDVQDILDDIAVYVEKELENNNLAGLLWDEPQLVQSLPEIFEEGDTNIAFLHLEFDVQYKTPEGDPESVA